MSSVDVVVPCYNYARYLPDCVASILTQDGVDVRVLIIDDTSSDDTPEVGRRLAAQDSRVEFRRHATNCGHIATYNEGLLGWAQADYSVLLSADDLLLPGALSRATSIMDRDPAIGLAYGRAAIITENSDIQLEAAAGELEYRVLPGEQFLERCFAHGNPVPTPAAVVRTSLQRELGGYRADLPHSADMEMWMRFAVHGPVAVLNNVLACYRWHAGNMSSQYYGKVLGDAQEQIQACHEIVSRWGEKLPAARDWLDATSKRLGDRAFWLAAIAYNEGNMPAYADCLSFAEKHYVNLRLQKRWWKLRVKSMLGQPAWQRVRSALKRMRGGRELSMADAMGTPYRIGQRIGWWPGSG